MSVDKERTTSGVDTVTEGVRVAVRTSGLMNETTKEKVKKAKTKRSPSYWLAKELRYDWTHEKNTLDAVVE